MKKTASLVSLLLICSILISAMSPVLQESVLETPIAVVTEEIVTENQDIALLEQEVTPDSIQPTQEITQIVNTPDETQETVVVPTEDNPQPVSETTEIPEITEQTETPVPTVTVDETVTDEPPVTPEVVTGEPVIEVEETEIVPEVENHENTQTIPVLNSVSTVHRQNSSDFRIIVSNMGNIEFSDVKVKFKTPVYTVNGSAEPIQTTGNLIMVNNAAVSVEGSEYEIGVMEPGKVVELVYHVNLSEGFSTAIAELTNEVSGKYASVSEEGEPTEEPVTVSSSASSFIQGENPHFAEIGVSLVDSKDGFYFPGESILHQVVVTNNSEFDMSNVQLSYNGLSASGYEDIPCIFTQVCSTDGCSTINKDDQDNIYNLGELGSADKSNHSVVLFCENGVNDIYYENVSYAGKVSVTADVSANEEFSPANSQASAESNQVIVEVMVPMALSSEPVAEPVMPADSPKLMAKAAPLVAVSPLAAAPLAAANDTSEQVLILRADCMNAACIANTDKTKSFYVTACNDGSKAYNSVTLSAINQTGTFKRYFKIPINSYSASGGYSESGAVTVNAATASTGSLAGNTCVVAVYETQLTSVPKDHTESKTFQFGVNADGQTGTVNVSVDGCYVPVQNPNIKVTVNKITNCVNPTATSVVHTVKVENTGTADFCSMTITANKNGKFTYGGKTSSGPSFTFTDRFYSENLETFTFTENLSGTELKEGTTHTTVFNVEATSCTSSSSKATATQQNTFEVCVLPKPSITVTPPTSTKCTDINSPEDVTFTIKNDGEVDFCKLDGEFQVKRNGSVIARQPVTVNTPLAVGKSTTVKYTINGASIGLKEGDKYEVHFVANAYTSSNGSCGTKVISNVDKKVDKTACKTGLTVTPPTPGPCQEMDSPEEIVFTVKNTGEIDYCKIEGTIEVISNGKTLVTSPVKLNSKLTVNSTLNVKFTVNPESLGLEAGQSYEVKLTVNGYVSGNDNSCTIAPKDPVQTSVQKNLCEKPVPSLVVTPPTSDGCHDMDTPEIVEFEIENNGEQDFCKIEGEFRVIKDGVVIGTQPVVLNDGLAVGESQKVSYTVNPEALGLNSGDKYEVHLVVDGYTSKNGSCTEKPLDQIDEKVEKNLCEPPVPSLIVIPPTEDECHDMDTPEEVEFTITNNGEQDFCKIEGTFNVIKDGNVIATKPVTIADGLAAGASTKAIYMVNAEELGLKSGDSYSVELIVDGYTSKNGVCDNKPLDPVKESVDKNLCEKPVPSLVVDPVDPPDTCQKMDEPEDTVFNITNNGEVDFCKLEGTIQVMVDGNIVDEVTVNIDEGLKAGESTTVTYTVDPAALGLDAGDKYEVKLVVDGFIEKDGECSEKPITPIEASVERNLCEEIKPVLNVINLNADCINAGDTLKFKGEIDIDENSSTNLIDVTTEKINWGGSHYDCVITSVKRNSAEGYVELPEDERSISYSYDITEKGNGAIGFICEAKTNPNEQMRNGRQLSFSASALVATNRNEYEINSNRITVAQKCAYVHTVSLPHTGDDTNMPLLIGLFSVFVITGAFSTFKIFKKKNSAEPENK